MPEQPQIPPPDFYPPVGEADPNQPQPPHSDTSAEDGRGGVEMPLFGDDDEDGRGGVSIQL